MATDLNKAPEELEFEYIYNNLYNYWRNKHS